MIKVPAHVHEIHVRFVRGLLMGLPPSQLRSMVTGHAADEPRRRVA